MPTSDSRGSIAVEERFARRFSALVEGTRSAAGKPYSLARIAVDLKERYGVTVTPSHLSRLRSGESANPTLRIVSALAQYFGVTPDYFMREDEDEALSVRHDGAVDAMRERGIEDLICSIGALSDPALDSVRLLVCAWQQVEQEKNAGTGASA
ncbi:helix-turn-helix domain-containing protein [Kineococcus sp. SYSU DK005]|uniref:helix-turn-helix domain-containing protein n=1 Tax=Kineococcus sp. SYSU DK005 TaxID=3383126 RepID=UPI003D7D6195